MTFHIRKKSIADKVAFVNSYKHLYTIKQICKVIKFPRSTYYEALVHEPSKREIEYNNFARQVKDAFFLNKQIYGSIKLHRILNIEGVPCSLKRVQRHMKNQGLRSVVVKKYRHHSEKGVVPDNKENILNQDFTTTNINQKWCTDITYIHVLKDGWTYLASVMDLYSRKIIGYAYGKTMTAELALKAVENACMNVPDTKGIILHSDLGSQYTSQLFEGYILNKEVLHSFSRKGNPYDNACIESFHSVLKKEEVYLNTY